MHSINLRFFYKFLYMPSFNNDFLKLLQDDYSKYPIFVETGTNKGETIFAVEDLFSELHTIEIKENLVQMFKNTYKGNKINFIHGDSLVKLKELAPTLQSDTIFFLDAHWMTGNSGKGKRECPLYEEIEAISHFSKNAIIIIDDYRQFGKKSKGNKWGEKIDWTDITKEHIISILKDRISKVYHLPSDMHKEDRLVLHINKK